MVISPLPWAACASGMFSSEKENILFPSVQEAIARTKHSSDHPSFPCPEDGQHKALSCLLLTTHRMSLEPKKVP